MSWTNYHSHSHFCDGKHAPEDYIREAIAKGFLAFGCSSHSPVPFSSSWALPMERLLEYSQEVKRLKELYKDHIEVYLGLEVDYIPGIIGPSHSSLSKAGLDYSVGSVHFVDYFSNGYPWGIDGTHKLFLSGLKEIFHGDIQAAVGRFFELNQQMIEEDCPDVVGHLDKIKMQNEGGTLFSETASWYQKAFQETLEVIRSKGVIVEVNTRGMYKKKVLEPYPSYWALKEMFVMGIPICLNSDSHHPDEIDGHFEETAIMLQQIGYTELWALLGGEWQACPFTATGLNPTPHG